MSAYRRSPFETYTIYTISQTSTILDLLEEAADKPNIYMEIYIHKYWTCLRRLQTRLRPFFVVELGLLRPIPCQTFKSITFIGCVLGLVLSKELENNDWVVGETILQKKLVLHLPSPTQCPSRSPRLLSPPSITQTLSEAVIVKVEYNVIQSQ